MLPADLPPEWLKAAQTGAPGPGHLVIEHVYRPDRDAQVRALKILMEAARQMELEESAAVRPRLVSGSALARGPP